MATKRKTAASDKFLRDEPDLPRELDTPEDAGSLFAGPDVLISDLRIDGLKLSEALELHSLHLDSTVLEKVAAPRAVIASAKWKDVRFSACDLANVVIRRLSAIRVEFIDCRMTGLRIEENAEWQEVLISGGDQRYAQFRFSSFRAAEFDGCDLQDADFYGADLRGCVFRRCNLRNVEMSKAKLAGADLRGSIVEGLRLGAEDVAGATVDAAQALQFAPLLGIRIL